MTPARWRSVPARWRRREIAPTRARADRRGGLRFARAKQSETMDGWEWDSDLCD